MVDRAGIQESTSRMEDPERFLGMVVRFDASVSGFDSTHRNASRPGECMRVPSAEGSKVAELIDLLSRWRGVRLLLNQAASVPVPERW